MTADQIMSMAREAGFTVATHAATPIVAVDTGNWWAYVERFAALVEAKEREARMRVAQSLQWMEPEGDSQKGYDEACLAVAAAIRARGTP